MDSDSKQRAFTRAIRAPGPAAGTSTRPSVLQAPATYMEAHLQLGARTATSQCYVASDERERAIHSGSAGWEKSQRENMSPTQDTFELGLEEVQQEEGKQKEGILDGGPGQDQSEGPGRHRGQQAIWWEKPLIIL